MNTAGERLRDLRKQRDMSMQELADRVGVHKGTIFKWEHGETPLRKASDDSLRKLASALMTTTDFLIYGTGTTASPDVRTINGSSLSMTERAEAPRTVNEDRLALYCLDILAMQNGFRIDYTTDGDVLLVRDGTPKPVTEQDLLDVAADVARFAGFSFRRLFGGES